MRTSWSTLFVSIRMGPPNAALLSPLRETVPSYKKLSVLRQQMAQSGRTNLLVWSILQTAKWQETFVYIFKSRSDLQNILSAGALSRVLSTSNANVTGILEHTFSEGHLKTQLPN